MQRFDSLYNTILREQKTPITSSLKPGDKVKDDNEDCEHKDAEGVVKRVKDLPETGSKDVESKHNTPGKVVEFEVTNNKKGKYKPKDKLTKTGEQLKRI